MGLWGGQIEWRLPAQLPPLPEKKIALEDIESRAVAHRADLLAAQIEREARTRALEIARSERGGRVTRHAQRRPVERVRGGHGDALELCVVRLLGATEDPTQHTQPPNLEVLLVGTNQPRPEIHSGNLVILPIPPQTWRLGLVLADAEDPDLEPLVAEDVVRLDYYSLLVSCGLLTASGACRVPLSPDAKRFYEGGSMDLVGPLAPTPRALQVGKANATGKTNTRDDCHKRPR